jgi:hypothetical protein
VNDLYRPTYHDYQFFSVIAKQNLRHGFGAFLTGFAGDL